jgi:hypothetical protein
MPKRGGAHAFNIIALEVVARTCGGEQDGKYRADERCFTLKMK